jgi:hypothetical protein
LEVNFRFLCDYADQSVGKMTAVGIGFDTIYAAKVPATHLQFFSVISISFSSTEIGEKRVRICLIDEDGNDVIPPLEATINIAPPSKGFLYRNQRIALALQNVTFKQYGNYSIRWLINGREESTISLRVAPPPTQPTQV